MIIYDPSTETYTTARSLRKSSAVLIGSAVADALGAPFEFGPPGEYTATFPEPVLTGNAEMVGGGTFSWHPGQFTDDTEMAYILGSKIVDHIFEIINDEYDNFLEDTYAHFKGWSENANDVGSTTRGALMGSDWRTGAKNQHERSGFSASNGCVMRIAPMGILSAVIGQERGFKLSVLQARLTHWDLTAACCAGIASEVIANGIHSTFKSPAEYINISLATALAAADIYLDRNGVSQQDKREVQDQIDMLVDFDPSQHTPRNGTALICLGQALWAVAGSVSFEDAVRRAIDLGHDTDTVAAVAGAIAGAYYGADLIPARWQGMINGDVPEFVFDRWVTHVVDLQDLQHLAYQIANLIDTKPVYSPFEPPVGPTEVYPGLYAANLTALRDCDDRDFDLVTLCRPMFEWTGDFNRSYNFYLIDQHSPGVNPNLHHTVEEAVATIDALLAERKRVIVHCHAGRSRTGFILKAWYMRKHGCSHEEAHRWLADIWPTYDPEGNIDFSTLLDNYR